MKNRVLTTPSTYNMNQVLQNSIPKHRKIAFIHIHRTGGTTISNLINKFKHPANQVILGHCHLKYYKEEFPNYSEDFFVFSMVRNPWARLFSWYRFLRTYSEQHQDFSSFLDKLGTEESGTVGDFKVNQLDYLTPAEDQKGPDFIARFEKYQIDLERLFETLELPLFDIPTLNSSGEKTDYRSHYSEADRKKVSQLCEQDIDEFKYSF